MPVVDGYPRMTDRLGFVAGPPESLARTVLRLGSERPLSRLRIQAAFQSRVQRLWPELTAAQVNRLLRSAAVDGPLSPGWDGPVAAGPRLEPLAALQWALADLLRRLPPTGSGDSAPGPGARSQTAAAELARASAGLLSPRNAAVFAELQRLAAQRPAFDKRTDGDRLVAIAVDLRLICSECLALLDGAVYVHRGSSRIARMFGDGGDGLLAHCAACWDNAAAVPFSLRRVRWQGVCRCGTSVFAWWEGDRARAWLAAPRARACSPLCARAWRREQARTNRQERRPDWACARCGARVSPARLTARYCSAACRQAAYRQRAG